MSNCMAVVTGLSLEYAPSVMGGEYAAANTGTLGTKGNANGLFTVYNFQVADYHTYFAAPEADKPFVWVHNAGKGYGTKLPKSTSAGGNSPGRWLGKRGNSIWESADPRVLKVTGDGKVAFKNGYPVFDKVAEVRFKKGMLTGKNSADFGLADKQLAKQWGDGWTPNEVAALRRGEIDGMQYTWHHHQNGKYMQLVPYELHSAIPHSGGASILKNGG